MAVIFKFETKFYENANIPVTFVGHPLADEVKTNQTRGRNSTTARNLAKLKSCRIIPGKPRE